MNPQQSIFLLVVIALAIAAYLEIKKESIKQMIRNVKQALSLAGVGWKGVGDSNLTSTSKNWRTFSYQLNEFLGSASLKVVGTEPEKKVIILQINPRVKHGLVPGVKYPFCLAAGNKLAQLDGEYSPSDNLMWMSVDCDLLQDFYRSVDHEKERVFLYFKENHKSKVNLTRAIEKVYGWTMI